MYYIRPCCFGRFHEVTFYTNFFEKSYEKKKLTRTFSVQIRRSQLKNFTRRFTNLNVQFCQTILIHIALVIRRLAAAVINRYYKYIFTGIVILMSTE